MLSPLCTSYMYSPSSVPFTAGYHLNLIKHECNLYTPLPIPQHHYQLVIKIEFHFISFIVSAWSNQIQFKMNQSDVIGKATKQIQNI